MKHDSILPTYSVMRNDCEELEYSLGESMAAQLDVFAQALREEGGRTNLMGPKELNRLWSRHILESIAYIELLDISQRVVDIGTGAGFPGIILAICGLSVTVIEPRKKRAEYLRRVKNKLELKSVVIEERKIENILKFPVDTQFTGRSVKGAGKLIELIKKGGNERFSLVYRVPGDTKVTENLSVSLPVPPLDRSGILVQYQIDEKNIPAGRKCRE
ncbi:MAG: class I SAM-dependent methyltransferase [FCB group bacterium]|nr:class I SAM-dependent methyltransferase [FCB group bacterium]